MKKNENKDIMGTLGLSEALKSERCWTSSYVDKVAHGYS